MTTVLVVRHGETDWNRDGRLQGWAPAPLNERGREQARAVGEAIDDRYEVDRIVASDLERTQETARLVREVGPDAPVAYENDWRERDMGRLQGFTWEELYEQYPEFELDDGRSAMEVRPQGGESLLDVRERVLAGWKDLTASVGDETVVLVTHGYPLRIVCAHVAGRDLLETFRTHSPSNCALNELTVEDGEAALVVENEVVSE